jgi:hydroxyacid-oxoacid transhydrogenase
MASESIFVMDTSSIKYGSGATREVGHDMKELGARRVMVVTDSKLENSEPVSISLKALRLEGIDAVLFPRARVEPTDISLKEAIEFAIQGRFDGYIGIGGGSSMDTAKVANLYATYPAEFLAYVNSPIGEGRPVPGRLRPIIAVPTTAGTGSETTGVAIFDLLDMHAKTGIAHRALRPSMGLVDPDNTRTLPRCPMPCPGVAHGIAILRAEGARAPCPPSRLPGIESNQRCLGLTSGGNRCREPRARSRRSL